MTILLDRATLEHEGVEIVIPGYEDYHGGGPIYISMDRDDADPHPQIRIWGDINLQDSTDRISLADADVHKRNREEE